MGRDRAAYMRVYRERKRMALRSAVMKSNGAEDRIVVLEAEVARLKRELATRPTTGPAFNSKPFTPVPKR